MSRILLFNPWNDLALAANDPHYTPPASALQMAADLSDLSQLWSEDIPWGWSPLQVRLMREAGVPDDLLPTPDQLAEYRAFASRQTAVRLLERLRATWPEPFRSGQLVGESVWCESEDAVRKAVKGYGDKAMLKAPWSGSGRGVHPVSEGLTEKNLAWVRRTLQRQGGVEVEPFYQKVQDFAMEFWAERGQVRYEGLSLFTTTDGGVYNGNLVATEEEKERRLSQYVSLDLLHEVRDRLLQLLNTSEIPTWYRGPFGIDMMMSNALHPLIELNFRMTMGWIALLLSRHLTSDETYSFRIFQKEGHYFSEMTPLNDYLVDNISQ